MQVILRDYNPKEDEAFIYATWTKNAWYASGKPQDIKKKWFADKIKEIKKALEKDRVRVACLKEDPSVIIGYIVMYNGNLEWIYVKRDYRSEKIQELLFNQLGGRSDGREEWQSGERTKQVVDEVSRVWRPS